MKALEFQNLFETLPRDDERRGFVNAGMLKAFVKQCNSEAYCTMPNDASDNDDELSGIRFIFSDGSMMYLGNPEQIFQPAFAMVVHS